MKNLSVTFLWLLWLVLPIFGNSMRFVIKEDNEINPNVVVKYAKIGDFYANDSWKIIGEIKNKSSVRYKGHFFKIVFYGDNDELLNAVTCIMGDIAAGKTKAFDCAAGGPDYQEIRYIKFQYNKRN